MGYFYSKAHRFTSKKDSINIAKLHSTEQTPTFSKRTSSSVGANSNIKSPRRRPLPSTERNPHLNGKIHGSNVGGTAGDRKHRRRRREQIGRAIGLDGISGLGHPQIESHQNLDEDDEDESDDYFEEDIERGSNTEGRSVDVDCDDKVQRDVKQIFIFVFVNFCYYLKLFLDLILNNK